MELAGFDEKLGRREEILSQIAELQKEQRRIEQEVKMYMKDSELAVSSGELYSKVMNALKKTKTAGAA